MLITIMTVLFTIISILIIILVLLQPSEGEGFASAFSGSSVNTFFGTKALSYAWKMTIFLASLFFILAVIINKIPRSEQSSLGMTQQSQNDAQDNPANK